MEGARDERRDPVGSGLAGGRRIAGRGLPAAWLIGLIAAVAVAGCASTTSIGRLLADPGEYDGEEVRIEGEVQESLSLLGPGIYRVDDGTGRLPVVSREGGAPRSGSRVVVEGTFRSAFTLGDRTLAALLEENRGLKD